MFPSTFTTMRASTHRAMSWRTLGYIRRASWPARKRETRSKRECAQPLALLRSTFVHVLQPTMQWIGTILTPCHGFRLSRKVQVYSSRLIESWLRKLFDPFRANIGLVKCDNAAATTRDDLMSRDALYDRRQRKGNRWTRTSGANTKQRAEIRYMGDETSSTQTVATEHDQLGEMLGAVCRRQTSPVLGYTRTCVSSAVGERHTMPWATGTSYEDTKMCTFCFHRQSGLQSALVPADTDAIQYVATRLELLS